MARPLEETTIAGMKTIGLMTAGVAGLLALSACGIELDAKPEYSARTFAHSGELTIEAGMGELRLVQGRPSEVVVKRWLRGKAASESSWTLTGGTLKLHANCTVVFGDCGARYEVAVPPGASLKVKGGDDSVSVTRLSQPVTVTTTGGDIWLTGTTGALRLVTREGRIGAARTVSPDVRARSDDGDIRLAFSTAPTKVDVRSNTGHVVTTVPDAVYAVTVESKNGAERSAFTDAGPRNGRTIIARSVDGDVRVSKVGD
jgi:hypothetical protein